MTLYQFSGGADGGYPLAPVAIGAGGVLYGTTYYGGAYGNGTVFSLTPPASAGGPWTEAVIYSFTGGNDGGSPLGGLLISATGVLYGTAGGGSLRDGVVFSLRPPASPGGSWTETVLHTFTGAAPGSTDGGGPTGNLVSTGGVFYGTTNLGGTYGAGTAFSLAPPAVLGGSWAESVLHSFGGSGDGAGPFGGLVFGSGGVLYGMTDGGGTVNASCPYGCGTVFSLTPPTFPGSPWSESVLYSFSGYFKDGGPVGSNGSLVIGVGGVLYGATFYGGAYRVGTIFSLTPPAVPGGPWTEAVLYNFSFRSGKLPEGGLTLSKSGTLYGTTSTGGGNGRTSSGAIFQLAPPASPGGAWKYTRLYTFPFDAAPMAGLVIGSGRTMYGATSGSALGRTGSVFSITF